MKNCQNTASTYSRKGEFETHYSENPATRPSCSAGMRVWSRRWFRRLWCIFWLDQDWGLIKSIQSRSSILNHASMVVEEEPVLGARFLGATQRSTAEEMTALLLRCLGASSMRQLLCHGSNERKRQQRPQLWGQPHMIMQGMFAIQCIHDVCNLKHKTGNMLAA